MFDVDFSPDRFRVLEVMFRNKIVGWLLYPTYEFIDNPQNAMGYVPFNIRKSGFSSIFELFENRRRPSWSTQPNGEPYPDDILEEVAITRSRATIDPFWVRSLGESVRWEDTIHREDLE